MKRQEKINAIIEDTNKNYAPYYDVIPNLIRERGYKSGIEIGIFCGGHAKKILETGVQLDLIDPYLMYDPGMPLMDNQEDWDCLCETVINILTNINESYSIFRRKTSDEAFKDMMINGYHLQLYDFIFIDGLHTYKQLKKDLYNYSKLIRKGGIIACHDYNHPTFPDLTNAIDEFVAEHNAKLVIGPLHLVYFDKTW